MNNPAPVPNQATATPAVALPPTPAATETPTPAVATPAAAEATPAQIKAGEKAAALTAKLRADAQKRRDQAAAQSNAENAARQNAWHAQQATERAARAEAEAAKIRAEYEAAAKDPYSLLEKAGVKPRDVIERAKAETDPLRMLEKRVELAEAKAAALEKASKDAEAKAAADRKEAEREAAEQTAERAFIAQASDEKKYPHLSKLLPEALIAHAQALIVATNKALARKGEPPGQFTFDEILGFLENKWSTAKAFAASGKSTGTPASGASLTQTAPSTSAAGSDSPGTGDRTVTNGDASQTLTLPKPVGKLTKAEEREQAIAVYRRAKAGSRATG